MYFYTKSLNITGMFPYPVTPVTFRHFIQAAHAANNGKKLSVTAHYVKLIALKIGLAKIWLGIIFVVSAVKVIIVMAWVLGIVKYLPHSRNVVDSFLDYTAQHYHHYR